MTAKPSSRVRKCEAKKRDAGLREVRVWVPDKPETVASIRNIAAQLRYVADLLRGKPDESK